MDCEEDEVEVQVLLLKDEVAEELKAELADESNDDEVEIGTLMLVEVTMEETTIDVKLETKETAEERWTVVVL